MLSSGKNFDLPEKVFSLMLRPVGKLSMLSEIVKVVDGGGGGGRFKMSSSGKISSISSTFEFTI